MSMAPSTLAKTSTRLWEVDTLRGIAIVLMVFYHFMWDIYFFQIYPININGTAWQSFARFIATLFLFVVGVSLTLSYSREARQTGSDPLFRKYLLRGAKIFGLGLIITVATYFFVGSSYVVFGILHLIGFSIFAGRMLYPTGVRRFAWPDLSQVRPVRGLRFLGRHSLLIYLVHQPILIGFLFLLGFRPG
jgi:uncharacterized membrane protein